MPNTMPFTHLWLANWMIARTVKLWGVADLAEINSPKDVTGKSYPLAISWVAPMNPHIMAGIPKGPNQAYADEYAAVNNHINRVSHALADAIKNRGFQALALTASERTDKIQIKGDFPHKTAATLAGLGWIGRHCQLITRKYGPWVRLATVFTDMTLRAGTPIERSFCGRCLRCVDACPANALKGADWFPWVPREEIIDVHACDSWKKENYYQYHNGHNCGICSSACPYGRRKLRKKSNNPV